jgi:hypothetical protein
VGAVHRAPSDYPSGKAGDVLIVEFTVAGVPEDAKFRPNLVTARIAANQNASQIEPPFPPDPALGEPLS